jgi:hypothetical protein
MPLSLRSKIKVVVLIIKFASHITVRRHIQQENMTDVLTVLIIKQIYAEIVQRDTFEECS